MENNSSNTQGWGQNEIRLVVLGSNSLSAVFTPRVAPEKKMTRGNKKSPVMGVSDSLLGGWTRDLSHCALKSGWTLWS